jgi:hypothetical protein
MDFGCGTFKNLYLDKDDHIVGVMVSVLVSSAVDHGFKPHSGHQNTYSKTYKKGDKHQNKLSLV